MAGNRDSDTLGMQKEVRMNPLRYTGKTARSVTVLFLILGLVMTVLPFALDADFMAWGGASAFIGVVILTTSLILLPFFGKRVAVMNKIQKGEGILAWWRYPAEAWEKERKTQIGDLGGMKIAGFVLGGIFLLIGIVLFATDPDDMGLFLAIMAGIGLLMVVVSQLSAAAQKKRLLAMEDEAIIHTDGFFYRGELTTWGSGMNRLKAVGWNAHNPNQLLFCYRQMRRHGDRRTVAVIPIPPGQEQVAINVVGWFNRPIDESWQAFYDRSSAEDEDKGDSEN